MENRYLRFKEAIKHARVSRSTLRRRLSDELKRSGLNWNDSPDHVQERTMNIVKNIDGIDEYGGSLYHWEYSTSFLDMVRKGVQEKGEYVQKKNEHTQERNEYVQEKNEHTQERNEYVQEKNEHTQEKDSSFVDHGQTCSSGKNKKVDYGHDHSQRSDGRIEHSPDHGQDYVQVDKNYLDMLREEYRAKKRLEEDYRNKDNQINLIVRNLSRAMETLKERIKVLEAPKEDYGREDNKEYIQGAEDEYQKRDNNKEMYE